MCSTTSPGTPRIFLLQSFFKSFTPHGAISVALHASLFVSSVASKSPAHLFQTIQAFKD